MNSRPRRLSGDGRSKRERSPESNQGFASIGVRRMIGRNRQTKTPSRICNGAYTSSQPDHLLPSVFSLPDRRAHLRGLQVWRGETQGLHVEGERLIEGTRAPRALQLPELGETLDVRAGELTNLAMRSWLVRIMEPQSSRRHAFASSSRACAHRRINKSDYESGGQEFESLRARQSLFGSDITSIFALASRTKERTLDNLSGGAASIGNTGTPTGRCRREAVVQDRRPGKSRSPHAIGS